MGNIVGNQFGLIASKNQATAITDSKVAGNEAKFYITKNNNSNTGETCNAVGNAKDGIALTINGNVLRGMSDAQEKAVNNFIGVNPAQVYKFKGTVATYSDLTKITKVSAGDVYNVTDPTVRGYPKETNFAATKDGTGATPGIWDSLGGIGIQVSTASNLSIWRGTATISTSSDNNTKAFTAVDFQTYSDTSERGNIVADGLTLAVSSGLSIDKGVFANEVPIPIINLNLSSSIKYDSGANLRVSTSIIKQRGILSLTDGDFPICIDDDILNNRISTMVASCIPLSSLGDGSTGVYMSKDPDKTAMRPVLGIKLATNYNYPNITHTFNDASDILKLRDDINEEHGKGLYISSQALHDLIVEISSSVAADKIKTALNAK